MKNYFKKIVGALYRNRPFKYLIYHVFKPRLVLYADDVSAYYLHRVNDPAFNKYKTYEFEEEINNQFNSWADTVEAEYLIHFTKKCIIEPQYGWIIYEKNKVFHRSLPPGIYNTTPLPHYIYYKRKKKVSLKTGVSLFYNWFNYWHFLNDTIGALMVLDKLNFDKNIPVIVPQRALKVQYVKDFFSTEYAKKWNWFFLPDDTYVNFESVYIVKCLSNIKAQFLLSKKIFETSSKSQDRKIFLDRNHAANGRYILNKDEILPIVKNHGFEVVSTEGMTMFQQETIFKSAKVLMGIHGAGLTNMFFRYPKPCTVLELFPENEYRTHYYWLAKELGFEYDCISGDRNENGSFLLDKEKFKQFMKSIAEHPYPD